MSIGNVKETQKESVTVGFLYESNRERLRLMALNGDVGFKREVTDKNLHRPGLALAGYVELFTYNRVQIFGNTEIRYLSHLTLDERKKAFGRLMDFDLPCIVITNNNTLDPELISLATNHGISVFQSSLETTKFVYFLSDFLDDQFAPQAAVHGSFIDVYGIGVLLTGRSAIGKSEVALDLVERGHRLVADDVVLVTRKGEGILMGAGSDMVKHFMEIRGLGLIDVRSIFGIRSIRFQKRVEMIVQLEEWHPDGEYTRTGLDHETTTLMGVELNYIRLPIFPGKNITVIVEVIAMDYLLKHYGYNAAKEFTKRLDSAIADRARGGKRVIDYFEHDFE